VTLWLPGYPDQAWQRNHEALTLAQEVAHPLSLAFALFFAAILHFFRRQGPLVQVWRVPLKAGQSTYNRFVHW
jgi:hypothetical protein